MTPEEEKSPAFAVINVEAGVVAGRAGSIRWEDDLAAIRTEVRLLIIIVFGVNGIVQTEARPKRAVPALEADIDVLVTDFGIPVWSAVSRRKAGRSSSCSPHWLTTAASIRWSIASTRSTRSPRRTSGSTGATSGGMSCSRWLKALPESAWFKRSLLRPGRRPSFHASVRHPPAMREKRGVSPASNPASTIHPSARACSEQQATDLTVTSEKLRAAVEPIAGRRAASSRGRKGSARHWKLETLPWSFMEAPAGRFLHISLASILHGAFSLPAAYVSSLVQTDRRFSFFDLQFYYQSTALLWSPGFLSAIFPRSLWIGSAPFRGRRYCKFWWKFPDRTDATFQILGSEWGFANAYCGYPGNATPQLSAKEFPWPQCLIAYRCVPGAAARVRKAAARLECFQRLLAGFIRR